MVQLAMAVAKTAEGSISRFSLTSAAMEEVTAVLETRPPSMPVRLRPLSAPRMRIEDVAHVAYEAYQDHKEPDLAGIENVPGAQRRLRQKRVDHQGDYAHLEGVEQVRLAQDFHVVVSDASRGQDPGGDDGKGHRQEHVSGKLASIPREKVTTAATAAVKSTLPRVLMEEAYPTATRMVKVAMEAMAKPGP